MKTINNRTTEHGTDELFLKRWSPRAMSGETIPNHELMTLFDASHWAPSAANIQPWRFIYAKKDDTQFEIFFNLLSEGNREWNINASVLVVVVSSNDDGHGGISKTHSLDTGAAWENLALQGSIMGLVIHGMGGFDREKAKTELDIPDDYTVEMMIAIGKPGKKEDLSQKNQDREIPSSRKPLDELVFKGSFLKTI